MPSRQRQTVFFAAVLLASHMHCVAAHAAESPDVVASLDGAAVPNRPDSSACEDGSGCICQGATLADATFAPSVDEGLVHVVPIAPVSELDSSAAAVSFRPACRPSVPGRRIATVAVRALLQSYLL